jgi:hypothetical protein
MYDAADGDTERARIRAELYAPPAGERARPAWRSGAAGVAGASALVAQAAAEDAQLQAMRQGGS